jgi:PTS system beta-glucosides-specific IIC component
MKYEQNGPEIVAGVGGMENIRSVYHCVTRVRFDLIDNTKADPTALKAIAPVMGTNVQGEQFQVIIGNDVARVFEAMTAAYPALKTMAPGAADAAPAADTTKKGKRPNPFSRLLDFIAGVFAPILPAIAGAGLLKGFLALFVSLGWASNTTDTYAILSAIADGVFYFLPMLVAVSAARKFGANMFVAMGVAGALLYPSLVTLMAAGDPVDFLGVPVTAVSYGSTVIPILLAIWLMSWVEKGMNRITPGAIKTLVVPLVTLFVVVPITLVVLGPLGSFVGGGLSGGINWLLDNGGVFAGIILGGLLPLIVMTGMHYALVPFIITNLATLGFDKFLPLTYVSNMGQAGAAFGVALRTKSKSLKSLAFSTSFTALMGVTEPAMYGVNLRFKKPFIAGMIGSAAGGAIMMGFGVKAYVLAANGGIPGLPALVGETFVWALVGLVVAFVIATVATLFLGFTEDAAVAEADRAAAPDTAETGSISSDDAAPAIASTNGTTLSLASPLNGQAVELSSVSDPTFAAGVLGLGAGIIPSDGELVSPVNGTVLTMFNTGHAVAIRSDDGAEILLHIGIDTVNLKGVGFTALVATGDRVMVGQPLVNFDLEAITATYDPVTVMIVTNTDDYASVTMAAGGTISRGTALLAIAPIAAAPSGSTNTGTTNSGSTNSTEDATV